MITDVPGVRAGHWTDAEARTGCTVVLFPDGTVASGEVRGGGPATREVALLSPERTVSRLDAVVLTGGSAFGLAACDGAVRFCEERSMGFPMPSGAVPIVVGLALYDLGVGDPSVRPGPAAGYAAAAAAEEGATPAEGQVGAGTGARMGGWWGPGHLRPGGVGTAARRVGDAVVGALVAVNALGDLVERAPGDLPDRRDVPTGRTGGGREGAADQRGSDGRAHTTLGVVATNAALDKLGCLALARAGQDGLARVLEPPHLGLDGDAVVAASVSDHVRGAAGPDVPLDRLRLLALRAVAAAVRSAAGDG